jgi:hypothetical protein
MKKFLVIKEDVVVRISAAMSEQKIKLAGDERLMEIEAHQIFAIGDRAPGISLIKGTANKIKKLFKRNQE